MRQIFNSQIANRDMESKYLRYNRELVNRFISDYKLPIVMNKEKYFFYFLELYEKEFSSLTKWKMLWDMIDSKFGGDEKKFLDDYYSIRDNIIVTVGDSNSYKAFNTMELDKYKIVDKPQVTADNVYNGENIGKAFISIDLKKANFQTLKYINKDIVLGADTYEEFIGRFTDLDYVKESKYTRQVIFGKLNPKRHITIEKYLINEVWKVYNDVWYYDNKIVSLSNDEIVIETNSEHVSKTILEYRVREIEKAVKERLGLLVKVEYYHLDGYQMYSMQSGNPRNTFYTKTNLVTDKVELICVPAPYYALTYKLFNGMKLEEPDYHFIYEGIDCRFIEEFGLKKLKTLMEWIKMI